MLFGKFQLVSCTYSIGKVVLIKKKFVVMQNPVWPVYQNTTVANYFLTKQCLNDLLMISFILILIF